MEVSECGDPPRSIDTVCFNNPTRDGEMKTPPPSQDPLFCLTHLRQILGEKKKEGSFEISTEEPLWGRGEWNGMHADLASISTNILYMIIFARTLNLLSIHIQIPDHIISLSSVVFPFPLLVLSLLKQYSHFNVNSVYAYLPLNPPPSFCTAFPQIPEKKLTRENTSMFMRPRICPSLPRKRQYIFFFMGYTYFLFSAVCESYIPIWYCIYDAWQGLQFSISSAAPWGTGAVQKSWLWQRGSLYIFLSVRLLCGSQLRLRIKRAELRFPPSDDAGVVLQLRTKTHCQSCSWTQFLSMSYRVTCELQAGLFPVWVFAVVPEEIKSLEYFFEKSL